METLSWQQITRVLSRLPIQIMNKNMKYLSSISLRVLIGLVILFSVWLLTWVVRQNHVLGQADSFSGNAQTESLIKNIDLPEVGSYKLQKIFQVPKLSVLDTKGRLQPISKFTKGKITLLTFFYERCSDAKGCPYAMVLFHKVRNKLVKDENLRNSVRLVHISFDPVRDTPMMLAGLEKRSSGNGEGEATLEWDFLTTASVNNLMPIVDGFGQNVDIDMNSTIGDKSLTYSHVLKAFLIDTDGNVREIYSTNYINEKMLLNDIKTLALERHDK